LSIVFVHVMARTLDPIYINFYGQNIFICVQQNIEVGLELHEGD